jgi:hypothetical protein
MVQGFGVEAGHPDVYESEGTNTRDYIRDGFIRIGGDFSGHKSDYLFFEGSIEAMRRHSRLIQDIVSEWAQKEKAVIELSNGKESVEVSLDDIFYTGNVGALLLENLHRERMLTQARRRPREIRVRSYRRRR